MSEIVLENRWKLEEAMKKAIEQFQAFLHRMRHFVVFGTEIEALTEALDILKNSQENLEDNVDSVARAIISVDDKVDLVDKNQEEIKETLRALSEEVSNIRDRAKEEVASVQLWREDITKRLSEPTNEYQLAILEKDGNVSLLIYDFNTIGKEDTNILLSFDEEGNLEQEVLSKDFTLEEMAELMSYQIEDERADAFNDTLDVGERVDIISEYVDIVMEEIARNKYAELEKVKAEASRGASYTYTPDSPQEFHQTSDTAEIGTSVPTEDTRAKDDFLEEREEEREL